MFFYRTGILTFALLYYLILHLVYKSYISVLFGYTGFLYDFRSERLLVTLFVIVLSYLFVGLFYIKDIYHHLIIAALIIPSCVMYSVGGFGNYYFFVTLLCCSIVFAVSNFVNISSFRVIEVEMDVMLKGMLLLSLLYIGAVLALGGFQYFNLSILAVYEYRQHAADNLPSIFGYISPTISKVVIPSFIVLSMLVGRVYYVLIGVVCAFFVFGLTAHKITLFAPFLALLFYSLSRYKVAIFIVVSCAIGSAISFLDFSLYTRSSSGFDNFGVFGSLFSRRVVMAPALLNGFYIEYFSQNTPYFWAESKLSFGLTVAPYDLSLVRHIGNVYFNSPDMAANTGWIGSGFANAGIWGALAYSVVLGLLLSLISSFGETIGFRFVLASSLLVIVSIITSTDIVTSLFTHGLLSLIVLYSVVPKTDIFEITRGE